MLAGERLPRLSLPVEHQRSQLDAFAGQRAGGRGWIHERRMRYEACTPVIDRIETFDEHHFVLAHGGGVEPAMGWIELHIVDLTGTVGIDEIRRDEVVTLNALSIGDSQRCILNRPADRPPDVDHGKAPAQEIARFLAE